MKTMYPLLDNRIYIEETFMLLPKKIEINKHLYLINNNDELFTYSKIY